MAIFSALGILLALLVARHRPPTASGFNEAASSAAAVAHTVPLALEQKKPPAKSAAL